MGRSRRSSRAIEQAEARANGLKSSDSNFDLGNGLIATAYDQKITATRTLLDKYNQTLALATTQLNELSESERALSQYSVRVLAAVKAKYGPDSSEYELAGGVRSSERKRANPKPATPKP